MPFAEAGSQRWIQVAINRRPYVQLDALRKSKACSWSGTFNQYANRLAHHYLLTQVNRLPSLLIFVYFINAPGMNGPDNEAEWRGAVRLLHAALGLPVVV